MLIVFECIVCVPAPMVVEDLKRNLPRFVSNFSQGIYSTEWGNMYMTFHHPNIDSVVLSFNGHVTWIYRSMPKLEVCFHTSKAALVSNLDLWGFSSQAHICGAFQHRSYNGILKMTVRECAWNWWAKRPLEYKFLKESHTKT